SPILAIGDRGGEGGVGLALGALGNGETKTVGGRVKRHAATIGAAARGAPAGDVGRADVPAGERDAGIDDERVCPRKAGGAVEGAAEVALDEHAGAAGDMEAEDAPRCIAVAVVDAQIQV